MAWSSASTRTRTPISRIFTGTGSLNEKSGKYCADRAKICRTTGNSRRKIGQTLAGRLLQVFYVPDEDPESVFVITAYEPRGKAKKAFLGDNGGNRSE